jgi:S-DNA-T family DNA segregation ATPase FtsK/SpoIIIE
MMFWKKSKLVVQERSPDTTPFEIPEIEEEKKPYENDRFVSPIFGRKVKDEVVIPNPHTRSGDKDLQFDSFRTKPKMTKEEMKRKYGTEYPEFNLVKGRNLKEAMESQVQKSKSKKTAENRYESEKIDTNDNHYQRPTSVDDFLKEKEVQTSSEVMKQEKPEAVTQTEPKVLPKKALFQTKKTTSDYSLPKAHLLTTPKKQQVDNEDWLLKQIDVLNRTFEEFSVGAKVKKYTKGPTVTRYEIELDSGVNVKKITGISDNIKMALAAKEIRLEAPIPGKNTVGIEVPNEIAEVVHFYDIVTNQTFIDNPDPLTVALGLDIDGNGVYTSITKMPHGLVAGATGSGKSVCINTILMSLLFKHSPEELKLMLIDPKMVELSAYNELPHLITPVITDPKIAMAGLKWAVEEMENRFVTFAEERVRDIKSYNKKVRQNEHLAHMPYIVIVVDELADLMMVSSSSVEEAIMRLTQKARACGIHLLIATQRPSTDVVKGTIKSNIPTRIAFMVSSYVDSMTIIDSAGADKLLGRGDMLFAESGKPQIRIQGAYISDEDILRVNDFIRSQRASDYYFDQENLVNKVTASEEMDELTPDVARYVVESQAASINKISKEFKIGFNRAQKIVETLFDLGVVSDNAGSRARDVLVDMNELEEMLTGK